MPLGIYKPNKVSKGHACSLNVDETNKVLFISIIKQASWDTAKRSGSFKENVGKPDKSVNIKLSVFEIGGMIRALKNNEAFSAFHSSPQGKLQLSFKPWMKKDEQGNPTEEQLGFGLTAKKTNAEDDSEVSFAVPLTFAEMETVEAYLRFSLHRIFAEMTAERGKVAATQPAPVKKAPKKKIEEAEEEAEEDAV